MRSRRLMNGIALLFLLSMSVGLSLYAQPQIPSGLAGGALMGATLPVSDGATTASGPGMDVDRAAVIRDAAAQPEDVQPVLSASLQPQAIAPNGPIAFVSPDKQLFVMDANGGNRQALAPNVNDVDWPTWTRGGETLAFSGAGTNGDRCLYTINLGVGKASPRACGFVYVGELRPSPSGQHIAFVGEREAGKTFNYVYDWMSGKPPQQIEVASGIGVNRKLRPQRRWLTWIDDNTVALPVALTDAQDAWELVRVDLTGKVLPRAISRVFSCNSQCNCGAGDWLALPDRSPDGKTIAFLGGGTEGKGGFFGCTSYYNAYMVDVEGLNPAVELARVSSNAGAGILRWSPDGQRLAAYGRVADDTLRLNIIDVSGTSPTSKQIQSHRAPFADHQFVWSPQGDHIILQDTPPADAGLAGLQVALLDPDADTLSWITPGTRPDWVPANAAGSPAEQVPLVFIPGIAGSKLYSVNSDNTIGPELWPGDRASRVNLRTPTMDLRQDRQEGIIANDVFREVDLLLPPFDPFLQVYSPLIQKLKDPGDARYKGYIEYRNEIALYTETPLERCQTSPPGTSLFMFPYDWRISNAKNADALAAFITCVRSRNDNKPVDIIAHSMGGLVASRYVLNHPSDHGIRKLITIATPWLGAPKSLNVLETGDFLDSMADLALGSTDVEFRELAQYMPGANELLPGPAYFELSTVQKDNQKQYTVLTEDGWDINRNCSYSSKGVLATNGQPTIQCNSDAISPEVAYAFINERYGTGSAANPGDITRAFHTPQQDDWNTYPEPFHNIELYHLYGVGAKAKTIAAIRATETVLICPPSICPTSGVGAISTVTKRHFSLEWGRGDGTVPVLSASRRWQGQDLNHSSAVVQGFISTPDTIPWSWKNAPQRLNDVLLYENSFSHGGLPNNDQVIARIWQILTTAPPPAPVEAELTTAEEPLPPAQPAYYLEAIGDLSISVSDTLGNSTDTLTTTEEIPLVGVALHRTGAESQMLIMPTSESYTVTLRAGAGPIMLDLTRGNAVSTTLAVRYLDLVIPAGKQALLQVGPDGITPLRYDGDDDGAFETEVPPTVSLDGDLASDVTPPEIGLSITGTWPNLMVTLTATDDTNKVTRLMYSVDGVTYRPVEDPLALNATVTPTFYAFAEDAAANRSGRLSFTLAEQLYTPLIRR